MYPFWLYLLIYTFIWLHRDLNSPLLYSLQLFKSLLRNMGTFLFKRVRVSVCACVRRTNEVTILATKAESCFITSKDVLFFHLIVSYSICYSHVWLNCLSIYVCASQFQSSVKEYSSFNPPNPLNLLLVYMLNILMVVIMVVL